MPGLIVIGVGIIGHPGRGGWRSRTSRAPAQSWPGGCRPARSRRAELHAQAPDTRWLDVRRQRRGQLIPASWTTRCCRGWRRRARSSMPIDEVYTVFGVL